jgi:hypothetical protein
MATLASNTVNYILLGLLLYVFKLVYTAFTRYGAARKLKCKEPPSPPQKDWFLGLDFVYQQIVPSESTKK